MTMETAPRRGLRTWLSVAVLGCVVLAACATAPGPAPGRAPEEVVMERAQERWDILLSGDLAGAYEYLTPGYRSSVSLQEYQRKLLLQRVTWTGAEVEQSECSESTCKVKISIDYTVRSAVPAIKRFRSSSKVDEDWLKVNGQWYLVPEN